MGLTTPVQVFGVTGLPEVRPGDDLAALIGGALDRLAEPGDILVVTSKIVSKAEGRQVAAASREDAITAETVRVVARGNGPGGPGTGVRIVQNRQGLVLAAAGVDASNVAEGTVLLLPERPDESAAAICFALRLRWGFDVGVVISDTLGRAWREGQVDHAIGAAGVTVLQQLQGTRDANGRELTITAPAIGDEIAAAADLVKGKASGIPVAVVRGLSRFVVALEAPGASSLQRPAERDLFFLGAAEADAAGYRRGYSDGVEAGMRAALAGSTDTEAVAHRHVERRAAGAAAPGPVAPGTPQRRATDLPRSTSLPLPPVGSGTASRAGAARVDAARVDAVRVDYDRAPSPPIIAKPEADTNALGEDGEGEVGEGENAAGSPHSIG